VSDDIIATTI